MSVAENIKKARENKGLKIEEAASICGIPLGTYRKYEAGSSLPTADPIRAMAKGFGVSTDEILMEPDERSVKAELRKLFSVVATLPECQQAGCWSPRPYPGAEPNSECRPMTWGTACRSQHR
ncbi:helix-turn-helix domain-containing protein [Pseudomonas syringae]|uniref:helix-turn-helix domain-containing protein n=1 Tax=Pseudomonas syringae TaxID=317 RepID=UPI000BFFCC8C|nr:helix-turn-helix transcriptional regulator [Pseudomonas syringae]